MQVTLGEISLKCSSCNRPLSVSPIYHNDHLGSACGRCIQNGLLSNKNDLVWERQFVLEKIANFMNFPCSYRIFGCTHTLSWNTVESHEKECLFAEKFCPLSHKYFKQKCSWIDEHGSLKGHINKKHKNMLFNPPIMKLTSKLENDVIFNEVYGSLFIITLIFDHNLKNYLIYISGIFDSGEGRSYHCEVAVGDESTSCSISDNAVIYPFSISSLNNPSNCLVIDPNIYFEQFSTNEVKLTFNISKENTVEPELKLSILQELECPVCVEYMKSLIYICRAGHNICGECHEKVTACPICRQPLQGGRNFTLENVASKIEYPCPSKSMGCNFIGIPQQLLDHKNVCKYFERKCFIHDCTWKGLHSTFRKHLEENHSDNLLQFDGFKTQNSSQEHQYYVLFLNEKMFVLKFYFEVNENLEFSVLNYEREKSDYIFSLTLIGCRSLGTRIKFSHICHSVPYTFDILEDADLGINSIPFKFLSQFLLDFHKIEFKISIQFDSCQNDWSD